MGVKKPIICPCGKLLGTTTNNSGGGSKVCPLCKRRVRYDCAETKVYTAYT